jgi:hypothetical protein
MKHRKHAVRGGLSILSVVVLIFVLNGQGPAEESATSEYEALFEKLQIVALEERVEAPDFSLPDINGNTVTLSELRGNVIFLNFWTTW